MKFGERLKKLRNEANETQETVSSKLHVSRQTISNWENEKSYPDIEMLIKLSDYYTISLDKLLKEDVIMENKLIDDAKKKRRYKKIIYVGTFLIVVFILTNLIWLSGIWSQNNYLNNNWEVQTVKNDYPEGFDGPKESSYFEKREGNIYLSVSKESYESKFRNSYLNFFEKTLISGSYVNEESETYDILNTIYFDETTFLVSIPLEEFMEQPLVRVDKEMKLSSETKQVPIDMPVSHLVDEQLISEANSFLEKNKKELLEIEKLSEKEYKEIN